MIWYGFDIEEVLFGWIRGKDVEHRVKKINYFNCKRLQLIGFTPRPRMGRINN